MPALSDFLTISRLHVGPVEMTPDKVSAPYRILHKDGRTEENTFSCKYEEPVFTPGDPESLNLASMAAAQVALNYGLFCEEIIFEGAFDKTDQRFLLDMMENTSREIYVNKLLAENEFLRAEFKGLQPEKQKVYTAARVSFRLQVGAVLPTSWSHKDRDNDAFVVLSSGGKDSLLSYGLLKELGKSVHPVFINESGRHWFTAINAYKHLDQSEPNTSRVWCNSDRIFAWMLRQLPFIRPDFANVRADMYPVRLWTVAVFLFGVMPVAAKRGAGRIIIGDEYDTTVRGNLDGITHYHGLYDQSKFFDQTLTRYFVKKGWNHHQFSMLRSLSELLILKILVKRYPDLQAEQVSCHAAHQEGERIKPCGKCEKCRRIVGMLLALDEDPRRCGYSDEQIQLALTALQTKSVKQIGPDASHLFHLLEDKQLISRNPDRKAKAHPEIMSLRFDQLRSMPAMIPEGLREELFSIFGEFAEGANLMIGRKWTPIDLSTHAVMREPYPFQQATVKQEDRETRSSFLWETMTWEDIQERLKVVDTAILPCGAIEQHGPHLPVDVDYFDAVYLAKRVAEACAEPRPFVLPPIPFGVSYHHEDFAGTISVSNNALSAFVYDIGMSLAKQGIKKLIILNGHGDNAPTLNFAAQMINRDARIFVCVDTGETSDEDLYPLIDTHNDIHAGEIETSTSLAIRPELVKMDRAVNETLAFGSEYLDFTSARGVPWYVRTNKISESGVMGDATKASAEKGRKMWDIMVAHLVRFVEEIKSVPLEALYQKRY